ncbi:hypothetical protein AGMMS50293_27110 [Spirochaetia bacterium]|nr:hypothetical protein AGMMS50293_27110 [Spirochaetia bacterium]
MADFWSNLPLVIMDETTGQESPLKEFNEVRKQLREMYDKAYPQEFIHFGDFTYGNPKVHFWGNQLSLWVGKFCSIAQNVQILLGGEHQAHWITTYPFQGHLNYFKEKPGVFLEYFN